MKAVATKSLAVSLFALLLPFMSLYADQEGNYTYSVANSNAMITQFTKSYSGALQITNRLGGYPVIAIMDNAFNQCTNLTSVTIPNGVVDIWGYAFASCVSLTNVTIPGSVGRIRVYTFSGCANLTSVTIPNSVTAIENGAFYQCMSLGSITIPNGVTDIGDKAFYGCSSLTNIVIPNGVESIGYNAFSYCMALPSVTIPASVTEIGEQPFYECLSLTNIAVSQENPAYTSIDGVLLNKDKTALIQYPAKKALTTYTIPADVTTIKYGAFARSQLISLTVPNGVTNLENHAFARSTTLIRMLFAGDPPQFASSVFSSSTNIVVYYTPAGSGWTESFGGQPTKLWNPALAGVGRGPGAVVSLTVTGTVAIPIAVQANSNLMGGVWSDAQAYATLGTNGVYTFNHTPSPPSAQLFYRISFP